MEKEQLMQLKEIYPQLPVGEEQLLQMEAFVNLLIHANSIHNLTRIVDEREIVVKHLADSIAPLAFDLIPSGSRVLDIGTGPGFPGIPLQIMDPTLHMTMMDSSEKKVEFVKEACSALKLPAQAIWGRAEELAKQPEHEGKYDIVCFRAVAALNILLELASRYLKVGGMLIAYKGEGAMVEAEQAKNAARQLGFRFERVVHSQLPNLDHQLLLLCKTKETPSKYPRRYTQIKKAPL